MLIKYGYSVMAFFIAFQIKFGVTPLTLWGGSDFHQIVFNAMEMLPAGTIHFNISLEDAMQLGTLIAHAHYDVLMRPFYFGLGAMSLAYGISYTGITVYCAFIAANPELALTMGLNLFIGSGCG